MAKSGISCLRLRSRRACRSFEQQQTVGAGDRAGDGDQTEDEPDPVQPFQQPESCLRLRLCPRKQPAVQEQRLGDEEHHGEQQPHRDHRVHPPISGIAESIPEIEPSEHVDARKPRQHRPDSRLPSKPALDGVKQSDPFVWRLEAANARQQYGRYKADAADPQDDRKNVQRADNGNIIHLPASPSIETECSASWMNSTNISMDYYPFERGGPRASATSTHRPLPQPETKARQRSRRQGRRRVELGSNAARCPCSFPYAS